VVLTEGEEITTESLPEEVVSGKRRQIIHVEDEVPQSLDFRSAKKDFERKYIEKTLEQTGGNVTRAAGLLGMHRQSLQHKLRELGLSKKFVFDE